MALIVAAGSGERLGSERAKAFVALGGRPMVEWSVEAVRGVPGVDRVVVLVGGAVRASVLTASR